MALHEGRGEIFVANDADDSVLVFKITDSGDVAPTRVIKGARTRIKNPTGVNVDAVNNELWVASMGNYTATVFPLTANGNVAPVRQIRGGPATGEALMIGNPGAVGYDSKRQEILVPELSGPSAGCGICQAGKWKHPSDATNLRAEFEIEPHDARRPARPGARRAHRRESVRGGDPDIQGWSERSGSTHSHHPGPEDAAE